MSVAATHREVRVDFSTASKVGATPVEVRPDGFRIYEGTACFGDVTLQYPDLVPPRVEYIPADDAMSPEALASLEGAPFTFGTRATSLYGGAALLPGDHPEDMLSPDTVHGALEGTVLRAWRHDSPGKPPELKVRVIVHTREAIDMIESGVVGLSLGYDLGDLEWTAGTGADGKRYDAVQRRRRYNHLNGVPGARSKAPDGRQARLDAAFGHLGFSPHELAIVADSIDGLIGRYPEAFSSYPLPTDATMEPYTDITAADLEPSELRRGDVGVKRLDMPKLGPDDLAKIKEMSPEAQAAMMALMAKAGMVEAEASDVVDEVAAGDEQVAATDDVAAAEGDASLAGADASDAAPLAAIMKQLEAMDARIAALEAGEVGEAEAEVDPATRGDAPTDDSTADEAAKEKARKDAEAKAAKVRADAAHSKAVATVVAEVRKDGHKAETAPQAVASALEVVKAHLPRLHPEADRAVKERRLDALLPLYQQAEDIRRATLAGNLEGRFDAFLQAPDSAVGDVPSFAMPARALAGDGRRSQQ